MVQREAGRVVGPHQEILLYLTFGGQGSYSQWLAAARQDLVRWNAPGIGDATTGDAGKLHDRKREHGLYVTGRSIVQRRESIPRFP